MISKSQISYIKSLHLKKFRKEHRQFIVEGDKLCDEFIQSNFSVRQIYLLDNKRVKYEVLLSKVSKKIEILELKAEEMAKISQMSTAPDVIILVDIPNDWEEQEFINQVHSDLVLMLDDVKDPGNLGTIIRIADWFGISHVICSKDSVELYNPKVVQSTMGSLLRVKLLYTDLVDFMQKSSPQTVFGALLNAEDVYKMPLKMKGILLMGSESHGISAPLLPFITNPISIPSFGSAESLNVAVATAILCSEARRRDN